MGLFAWVVRAIVAVLLLSAGAQAGYKPVDISDIKGEDRKDLGKAAKAIADFPLILKDAFLCERLGLCFKKDGSKAMNVSSHGRWRVYTYNDAWYVTGGGKLNRWGEKWGKKVNRGLKAKGDAWGTAYDQWEKFHTDPVLSFYPKDVERLTLSTAKYLLKTMPREHRWLTLALIGNMVYNDQGTFDRRQVDNWWMENGIIVKSPHEEGRGYVFMNPEGKECDIRALLAADNKDWRWRQVVWRCENLVGSKDILALFPEEVKAMRKHYGERVAKVKDAAKAKNDALLVAADEMMSSLPREKRLARIALAMGLYYLDHRDAGCSNGHLNLRATIILPDGSKHSGQEFIGEAPGFLQQVPHEAILEFYRQPIEQMARAVAKERFGSMPAPLRDLTRAQLSRKLINLDGSPAKIEKGVSTVQTFDRAWKVPMDGVDRAHTYFLNSAGQKLPYSMYNTYEQDYEQTLKLVNLCAQILGKEETVKLIPPGDAKTESDDTTPNDTDGSIAEASSIPPGKTALGNTTREGADTPQDKLLAQGQTALKEMPAEQRYAWLAEKMGFCFTEDGGKAYQSERTANGNAVYVDAQGNVRKLSDAPGKDSPGWTETTNAARIVGYDQLTAPYGEELKQLAVQTSKHILASMPPGLRQSWLAERNKFFLNADGLCSSTDSTLESGVRISFCGTYYYEQCRYYDPNGQIVQTTAVGDGQWDYWWLLYYCETVVGIDAINAQFSAEVESMRAAFRKSPFYKK